MWFNFYLMLYAELQGMLNSPISMGHSNSLKPTLIFNPRQISSFKLVWPTLIVFLENLFDYLILCYFCP